MNERCCFASARGSCASLLGKSLRAPPYRWADRQGIAQTPPSQRSVLCPQGTAPVAVPRLDRRSWGAQQWQGTVLPRASCHSAGTWTISICPQPCSARLVSLRWLLRLSSSLASRHGANPAHATFPGAPFSPPLLHPSQPLHHFLLANPAAALGEALIQPRAPCQLCQEAEMERGAQHWKKPLHDPVETLLSSFNTSALM